MLERLKRIMNPRWLPLDFAKLTALPSFVLLFRTKRHYRNKAGRKPRLKGPAIIISNHTCFWDPLLLTYEFFFRRLRFLATQKLYEISGVFSWLLHKAGCIVVDKDQFDFRCVSSMVEVLEQGGVVGIFPEGKINEAEALLPFKQGVVLIALKTGAPIYPVYLGSGTNLKKRQQIVYGEPIFLQAHCKTRMPSLQQIEQLTQLLQNEMEALRACLHGPSEAVQTQQAQPPQAQPPQAQGEEAHGTWQPLPMEQQKQEPKQERSNQTKKEYRVG